MPNENTPENIKRLRQKIGLTQKECAEIFSMSPRTWRRKEEPVGTASGTALTPVEFKFLLLLASRHCRLCLNRGKCRLFVCPGQNTCLTTDR